MAKSANRCVPESSVLAFESSLPWQTLGALPEMLQTTHGSLYQALDIQSGQTLLIRGGTSSIGLCALEIARLKGLKVISTTRSKEKFAFLRERGAAEVLLEDGEVSKQILALIPEGINAALELVGTSTLLDTLQSLKRGGTVCMTGILGNSWDLPNFKPMEDIPSAVKLTSYSGTTSDLRPEHFQSYLSSIESGLFMPPKIVGFKFEELRKAHEMMDENRANGKIVITPAH